MRLRPGLIFKARGRLRDPAPVRRAAAADALLRRRLIPIVPAMRAPALSGACTRSTSATPTGWRSTRDVRGAFNVAAEPVLDPPELGRLLDARPCRCRRACCAAVVDASWKLRLQPTPPGWLDMALGVPLMDVTRAREELGWTPTRTRRRGAARADRRDAPRRRPRRPPPLQAGGAGPLRVRELLTGVGARSRG